jgi:xylulokinase
VSDAVTAIGIASMAESGLLIDKKSGMARSYIVPWFDQAAQVQANHIAANSDPYDFYVRTGLRINYKCSLAKILWLRNEDASIADGAIWLSVADYIAYRLTGEFGTDGSLAGRTGAFDIHAKKWDGAWLEQWGLSPDNFPPVSASGQTIGQTSPKWSELGIPKGTPVAISGHDHICAAYIANLIAPGQVFDSMGTAEVLIGSYPERALTSADYKIGLLGGCHVVPDQNYWLGSLSSSGGAVEWLRHVFNDEPLSYEAISQLIGTLKDEPTGILFFPYLLGSGAPHSDPLTPAAWVGLRQSHTRAHLAKAVLEGTAFEMEVIRRAGERMSEQPISTFVASGGGTRNRHWMQIKADVSGCPIHVLAEADVTLLGAAFATRGEQTDIPLQLAGDLIAPDPKRHRIYQDLFEQGYMALQSPLRHFSTLDIQKG